MLKVAAASFVFGFLAVGLLLFCFSLGLGTVADIRGWGSFGIGGGPLTVLSYERTPGGTETVVGGGVLVLALLAGVLNAVAGAMLSSRSSAR